MNKRIAYFDNVKAVLIFLVMFGHFIEPIRQASFLASGTYKFIYSFHMPFFIIISGFFSKKENIKGDMKLIALYFIFQIFYTYFFSSKVAFFTPKWGMWYLFSLVFWRNIIKYIKVTSHPILISLFIGLISGYFAEIGGYFSLSRILTFLPFFTIGYYADQSMIVKISSLLKKRYAFILIILIYATFIIITKHFDLQHKNWWFGGDKSYKKLIGSEELVKFGFFYQLLIYCLTSIMIFLVANIIPKIEISILGYIGKNSLYVYLGHTFFTRYFARNGFHNKFNLHLPHYFVISVVLIMLIPLFVKLASSLKNNINKD